MSIETNVSDSLPFYTQTINKKQVFDNDRFSKQEFSHNPNSHSKPLENKNNSMEECILKNSEENSKEQKWNSFYNDLPDSLRDTIFHIIKLFINKNSQYSTKNSWASAFYDNQLVLGKHHSVLSYAMSLVAKQDKAAIDAIFSAKNGEDLSTKGGISMVKERLMDGAVYRLIMLALLDESEDNIYIK